MNHVKYSNQPQNQSAQKSNTPISTELRKTTGYRFNHSLEGIDTTLKFNSVVDRMQKEGWEYYECIHISQSESILVFTRA